MKIAMLGHKRIPGRAGGIEVVVGELSERMVKKGHEVTAYNRWSGEEKVGSWNGVRIKEVRTPKVSGISVPVYSFFAALGAAFGRYDVVHFHAEGPCAMIPLVKLFRKKVIATIHGLDWQRSKWGGFASRYIKFGEKMAAKYAERIIVLSGKDRDYFKETYDRDTVLIPNGIARVVPEKPDLIKRKFGLEKDGYILFLARITPEKGLDYLIDAYRKLDTDKKLVIAGSLEPETDYIRSVQEKCRGWEDIIFTGFVNGKLLSELFSNCYVYILPSDIEGMPMSLLEAVGYDARVIVSDIPENTACLSGYGNTFTHGNSEALREVLEYCLTHGELKHRDFKPEATPEEVREQRERLMEKYDWDNITEQTLALYRSVQSTPAKVSERLSTVYRPSRRAS